MEGHISTTPFGRRSLSLAHVAAQAVAKTRAPDRSAHKWHLFRAACTAKERLGVSERALAVLNALLTFYPETVLAGDDLIVFPSNEQLALRAHGMAASTLRRHLAGLVDAGLVVRRDSPNGKRYARRRSDGAVDLAFGFDLAPLLARADEIEQLAEVVLAAERALKRARERLTILRRDIAKMIATGIEEAVPTSRDGRGPLSWHAVHVHFRSLIEALPRNASLEALEETAEALSRLSAELFNILEAHVISTKTSANESQSERHKQNSNPDLVSDSEPRSETGEGTEAELGEPKPRMPEKGYPLGLVLRACPDIADYARGGIGDWRGLVAAAETVRPMLGISPSAWEEALRVMGEIPAAIVLAAILQRTEAINSAGGYLRSLTRKAAKGEFSLGPVLMALLAKQRQTETGKMTA